MRKLEAHLLFAHFRSVASKHIANDLRKQLQLDKFIPVPNSAFSDRCECECSKNLAIRRERKCHARFRPALAKGLTVSRSFGRQLTEAGELDHLSAHDDLLCPWTHVLGGAPPWKLR